VVPAAVALSRAADALLRKCAHVMLLLVRRGDGRAMSLRWIPAVVARAPAIPERLLLVFGIRIVVKQACEAGEPVVHCVVTIS
jgi:IS5 family transposase